MAMYNSYSISTVESLRAALRNYLDLAHMPDETSATIYLDLRRALGDDPDAPVTVITNHQRRLVQQNLIEGMPVFEVAKLNNITPRVVHLNIRAALESLMEYLNGNIEKHANAWKPWMIELLRDPYLSLDEIVAKTGKSKSAISCAMTRYRKHEAIPFRAVRKRVTRSQSE